MWFICVVWKHSPVAVYALTSDFKTFGCLLVKDKRLLGELSPKTTDFKSECSFKKGG